MARGTQLLQLVSMLRAETGYSTLVSAGIDNLPTLQHKIRRSQEMLYDDYDWPFLRVRKEIVLSAGEQYYDMPDGMDPERIEEVKLWYNGRPQEVERGINLEDYASFDSDADERSDPVMKWDIISTGDTSTQTPKLEQVEAWPIPASNGSKFKIVGLRRLRPLIANSDVCDIDDLAIVLNAAAEILEGKKKGAGSTLKQAARERIFQMKGRQRGAAKTYTMGTGSDPSRTNRGRTIIRVS